MKVKGESEVAQFCPTLHDPMVCSLPDSSVHGISQARVLDWVAIAFSYKKAKMFSKPYSLSLCLMIGKMAATMEMIKGTNNGTYEQRTMQPLRRMG